MKLKTFKIKNYKSINDSGVCRLSDNDNILVIAGQNESGKSSILQALHDFERNELREGALQDYKTDFQYPEIECTYSVSSDDGLFDLIKEELHLTDNYGVLFNKITELTLIRKFTEEGSILDLDMGLKSQIDKLLASSKKVIDTKAEGKTEEVVNSEASDGDVNTITTSQVAEELSAYTPRIIFFDDFCDLLPDKIYIKDLLDKNTKAQGYKAVKNIEGILNTDFTKFSTFQDGTREAHQDSCEKVITANFNERWHQKINAESEVKISIRYNQGGKDESGPYLKFFVLSKTGQYLTPQQRSQGLKWFLSFYFELTSQSKSSDSLVILFDEPGLYLHSRAQADIKNVFEELSAKDQIIYSTHSPYLIDTNKLNRVRLVLNTENEGTLIEKITTGKVKDQLDALKPIVDAMGLDIAHQFSPIQKNNVILEGISDFNYFQAFKKLLNNKEGFNFVPSMGAQNVHLLMELCIGWGLNWLIIMDDDSESQDASKKIEASFFGDEPKEMDKKLMKITGANGIEEVFTLDDLKLARSDVVNPENKSFTELVKSYGGKELFSRLFLEKVNSKEIKQDNLNKQTVKKFEKVFKFISDNLK